MAFLLLLGWMVRENQYLTRSETPSLFGCGYAALWMQHLTQRGNARRDILYSPADRTSYLGLLQHCAACYQLQVLGYCLLSNHVHRVVVPPGTQALAHTLFDFSLWKVFSIPERVKLRVQADAFNAFNQADFRGLKVNMTNLDCGSLKAAGPGRNVQLGARLVS